MTKQADYPSGIVLLTREPSREWFSFLNNIITSDVFTVVVDDNCCDVVDDNCCDVVVNIMRMIIFRICADECRKKGICNFFIPNEKLPGGVLAWDKAITLGGGKETITLRVVPLGLEAVYKQSMLTSLSRNTEGKASKRGEYCVPKEYIYRV
jgi:hypothetical protein